MRRRASVPPLPTGSRSTRRPVGVRAGMTLIEVVIAVMILAGVFIGMSNFTRRFQSITNTQGNLATASELAAARIEYILQYKPYSSLVSTFNSTSESSASSSAQPSMAKYPGFTRTTAAVRTGPSTSADYVTVTVTVTNTATSTTISKSVVIAAF